MRARAVVIGATGVIVPVILLAYSQRPRQVELPVYDEPIRFFEEGKQALVVADLPAGLTGLSAAECGACHSDQHAQWQESAHGKASTQPVFTAAFKAEQRFVCRSCHSPLQEQHPRLVHQIWEKPNVLLHGAQSAKSLMATTVAAPGPEPAVATGSVVIEPNPKYSATLAAEGVNCAACHVRDGTILTAKATGSSRAPHALSYSPQMARADYCAGCHQFNIQNPASHPFEAEPGLTAGRTAALKQAIRASSTPVRVRQRESPPHFASMTGTCDNGTQPPICPMPELESQYQQEPRDQETFDEFKSSPAALRGETCQSCHMPKSKGDSPGHHWPASENLAMLRKAVSLQARLAQAEVSPGQTLETVIEVKNDAGHRFPTGDSIYAGIVDVWLKDGPRTLSRKVFVLARQPQPSPAAQVAFRSFNSLQAVTAADGSSFVGPTVRDTRIKAGQTTRLRFRQKIDRRIAAALKPVVEVRVYYSAVHPGFRGSRIDPGLKPVQLIQEERLPVKVRPERLARLN